MTKWRIGAFLLAALMGPAALAEKGIVELSHGGKTYVEYQAAQSGQPTLVLLNGLTYSTKTWNAYVSELQKLHPGLGLLRYDMIGMGQTLLKGKLPVDYEIPYMNQVEQLRELLDRYHLKKVHLAGLSYGGGIEIAFGVKYPAYVQSLIIMAPFTEPLKSMDNWIRQEVAFTRITFPLNPASDEELYDYYLRQFIYTYYPSLEPSSVENPYKLEGIFRMVQGIRHYETLEDATRLPAGTVHLVVASRDQYIAKEVHDRFWNAVAPEARASRIDIDRSEHKIPESVPAYAAAWTEAILKGRPELSHGREFTGKVDNFTASSGSVTVDLHQR